MYTSASEGRTTISKPNTPDEVYQPQLGISNATTMLKSI
jgi:hypothetical protein